MSDIFISYCSADTPRVRTLVACLEQEGWTVWWDRTIPPGRKWDEIIETELAQARCVIVVWSKQSLDSEWVRIEAEDAKERGVLVPVLLEDVKIPLAFRRIQAARLEGWSGESEYHEFRRLCRAVSELTAEPNTIVKSDRTRLLRLADVDERVSDSSLEQLEPRGNAHGNPFGEGHANQPASPPNIGPGPDPLEVHSEGSGKQPDEEKIQINVKEPDSESERLANLGLEINTPARANRIGAIRRKWWSKVLIAAALLTVVSVLAYKTHNAFLAEAHYYVGTVYRDKYQNRTLAMAEFRKAIWLKPDYAEPHYDLAVLLHYSRIDVDEAIVHYREAIRIRPDYMQAHYNLANALSYYKNDVDGAIAEYREAVRLDPRDAMAHFYLGNLLGEKGNRDGARDQYRVVCQLNPNFNPFHLDCRTFTAK